MCVCVTTYNQQCNLEKETKGHSTSVVWRDARRLRITDSSVEKVPVRATTSAENFLREQLYPSFRGNYATEHGRTSEPKALQALKEMGFVISPRVLLCLWMSLGSLLVLMV